MKALFHVWNNGVDNVPGCNNYSVSNIDIEFDNIPEFSWGIDGEEYKPDTNKFSFTINKEINLLLPNNNIDKLFIK